ncbi:hypothetical protein BBJ28_00023392 [Nothophytophthora sp. Chile5]|nr:hypothetical protein BBJ28_00023392 [Nothophytophthora sp. Chile5]
MVDKDMNEIHVLQNHFPEARVLICHFHAIEYLKEMRSKPEYGGKSLSSEDAAQIDAVVHKMVYASDTCMYDEHYQALRGLCSRLMLTEFFDYFDRNWHVCQDRWVMYRRSKLPHMRNNTNNLLESFFGKLKDCVDGSTSMAMCVKALVSADRRAANEYRHRKLRIGHYVNANHDEELANLLRATTHYVADQIAPQYSIGMEKADVYAYDGIDDEPSVVMVRGRHTAYRLQLTDWACEEATRATHLIANELADIEDGKEFEDMMEFVLDQWRNVRQRKRTRVVELTNATVDLPPTELSQPHSLWSEELGNVAIASGVEEIPATQKSLVVDELNPQGSSKRKMTGGVSTSCYAETEEDSDEDLEDDSGEAGPSQVKIQMNPKARKLLDKCLALLPIANTVNDPVILDTVEVDDAPARSGRKVEVLQINGVGAYTRDMIETMQRVTNLKLAVEMGNQLVKWLLEDAVPALPAEFHETARKAAGRVSTTYPFERVSGLDNVSDYNFYMLYRATPPTWLNDAFIRALCDRLANDSPAVHYGRLQTVKPKSRRVTAQVMDSHILDRVKALVEEYEVDAVLIPVNFESAHWCGIVVKLAAKRIYFYDPLNQAAFLNVIQDLAWYMKRNGFDSFDVVAQNNPIQFDLYSCGLFVCWFFIRMVVTGVTHDMTPQALIRRRFEAFY